MHQILVIEDNTELLNAYEAILSTLGYEIVSAQNGVVGLSRLVEQPIDLVICDSHMPHLDGYAVLNQLKRHPATAHLPVILITTDSPQQVSLRTTQAAPDAVFYKPVRLSALVSMIEQLEKASMKEVNPL